MSITPTKAARAEKWLRERPELSDFAATNGLVMMCGLSTPSSEKLIELVRSPYQPGEQVLTRKGGQGFWLQSQVVEQKGDVTLCRVDSLDLQISCNPKEIRRSIRCEDLET